MRCVTPTTINGEKFKCGTCEECIRDRRAQWALRLELEDRVSSMTWFITLTYDDEHLPLGDWYPDRRLFPEVVPTFNKKHVQDFLKRLRWHYSQAAPKSPPVRYFLTAEYGDQYSRPHYHMLIYNLDMPKEGVEEFVLRTWQQGMIQVESVHPHHFGYLTKYMYENSKLPEYARPKNDHHPFMLCSTRPGIGKPYFRQSIIDFYRQEPKAYIRTGTGVPISMPRYFCDLLYDSDMRALLSDLAMDFRTKEDTRAMQYFAKYGDVSHFGTLWQESVADSKLDRYLLKRELAKKQNKWQ